MALKTMSFEEFFNMDKRQLSTLDKIVGHIEKNKKLYKQLVVSVAVYLILNQGSFAFAEGINVTKIDKLGIKALGIIRNIGYWAILVKGGSDIVGHAVHGNAKEAFKSALSYAGIFGILFLFPMMLDMVKEAFSK